MSDNDLVLLDARLESLKKEYEGSIRDDDFFEIFAFEQALKDEDLSGDEIEGGQTGGGEDGGIDGAFTFLDGVLLQQDSEVLDENFDSNKVNKNASLDLILVQAKQTPSFGERAFESVSATLEQVLDLNKSTEDLLKTFSPRLVDQINIFREAWIKILHPRISVRFVYASRGDTGDMNSKIEARAKHLKELLEAKIPGVSADVELLGARELLERANRSKTYTLELEYNEMAESGESHVALVSISNYFAFITDEDKKLRKYIFDWNVRDYEGQVEVNKEIRATLDDPDSPEFWWLNNGVTVICSEVSAKRKTFSLDDVQIVNGLQTSFTIFDALTARGDSEALGENSVLVRIIETDDPKTRDAIIRATNRQTSVLQASLRATDQVQRDLEQHFLNEGWYYERRKNYYRNQKKPASKIISIPYMAQAMAAIGLSEPGNARARPSSILKSQDAYSRIFDPDLPYETYFWAARTQRSVDDFLKSEKDASLRTNIRFHVSMLLAGTKLGKQVYSPKELGAINDHSFSSEEIKAAVGKVKQALVDVTSETGLPADRVSKGKDLEQKLISDYLS